MSAQQTQSPPRRHGDVLTAVSDGIVAVLKEFSGRGPTSAKSYYHDDLVICLLRGGYSRVERTLWEAGRGAAVIEQRMDLQELMRERFGAVVEAATGRRVVGCMSANQQGPDVMCEVFIVAGADPYRDSDSRSSGPGRWSINAQCSRQLQDMCVSPRACC